MYIQPNSTVKLMTNVPLDNTYEDTVYFTTTSEQETWMNTYVKTGMVFDHQYYQRAGKGSIKLEVLVDNIYDCNYMMFQNTSYGSKWFYAFITGREYVNDNVTLITYEIDRLQTWLFNFTLKSCFVEREHSATDVAGDNLLPENFDVGDPFVVSTTRFIDKVEYIVPEGTEISNLAIVIAATWRYNPAGATYAEQYVDVGGIKSTNGYSGLYYNIVTGDSAPAYAQTIINGAGDKASDIVNVFYAFRNIVEDPSSTLAYFKDPAPTANVFTYYAPKSFGNFGSYTPHNKKIYTHPYTFLRIKDGFGNFRDFKYEYCTVPTGSLTNSPGFDVTGDLSPSPSVICIPKYYMGETKNYSETAILTGFPQCAWNSDAYVAWLAQTGIRVVSDITGGVLGGMVGGTYQANRQFARRQRDEDVTTSGGRGAWEGFGGTLQGEVSNILSGFLTTQLHSRQVAGSQNSMLSIAADMMFIDAEQMQIREEYARIVDSYWDKFGYPVRRVKVPAYTARPKWNYIKTIGCTAVGKIPTDDLATICTIFDKGITWWNKTATVGDYTQNNALT